MLHEFRQAPRPTSSYWPSEIDDLVRSHCLLTQLVLERWKVVPAVSVSQGGSYWGLLTSEDANVGMRMRGCKLRMCSENACVRWCWLLVWSPYRSIRWRMASSSHLNMALWIATFNSHLNMALSSAHSVAPDCAVLYPLQTPCTSSFRPLF